MNKKVSTAFAITVIAVIAFALGFSCWMGEKYTYYPLSIPCVYLKNKLKKQSEEKAQIANPASVYCVENGGKLEIRTGKNGGQVGYCKFNNGKECEEWAFFRKECDK